MHLSSKSKDFSSGIKQGKRWGDDFDNDDGQSGGQSLEREVCGNIVEIDISPVATFFRRGILNFPCFSGKFWIDCAREDFHFSLAAALVDTNQCLTSTPQIIM